MKQTFFQSLKICLKKYVTFSGRASRTEFWHYYVFWLIIGLALSSSVRINQSIESEMLRLIINIIITIPLFAVGSRRLHDIGKSGWWQLIQLSIIGYIPLIYWLAKPSVKESNIYGEILE